MPAGPLEPGDPRVLGAFQVVGRLGEGGQGIVYEGRGASGDRVAIKVLRGGTDPDTRRRLARELESARRVAPFCTARVLEAEPDGPVPYVVSEFVAGPSLQERVRTGGPLRDGDLDRLAVGTACALAAIHGAGVVHRDFKPANVLLGPDGPRVVDFGIARPLDAGTAPSTLSGTPPYMAPEQLKGDHGSPAADVFAWAATMVYAATGRAPFGSDTVAAVFQRILTQEPDLSGIPRGCARRWPPAWPRSRGRARPPARS
ncbi:serine/threonine-protein kinase [Nonomuraea antimicrobica]